jgi:hypothetical protein
LHLALQDHVVAKERVQEWFLTALHLSRLRRRRDAEDPNTDCD